MNNNVPQIFNFKSTQVRVQIDETNEVWFLAKDICDVLDHSNPSKAIADHVDTIDVTKRYTYLGKKSDGRDNVQQMQYVNESGLYSLVLGSKKQEAKEFKRWVTSEVLPTIRKTGTYTLDPKDIDLEKALKIALEGEIERKRLVAIVEEQQAKIEEDAPKVEMYDKMAEAEVETSLASMAQLLRNFDIDIGRTRLVKLFRLWGWYKKETPTPIQQHVANGYFTLKQVFVPGINKVIDVGKLTWKGEQAVVNKIKKTSDNILESVGAKRI